LADRGGYFGTSSWKYDGWLGSIYREDRYLTRGKFSNAKFEENCLAEYAETFSTVCGDLTCYQFPSADPCHSVYGAYGRTGRSYCRSHLRFLAASTRLIRFAADTSSASQIQKTVSTGGDFRQWSGSAGIGLQR
jgi:hypothetical protein